MRRSITPALKHIAFWGVNYLLQQILQCVKLSLQIEFNAKIPILILKQEEGVFITALGYVC